MAGPKGVGAPASFEEGANGIVQAITATMTAADAGPHLPFLQSMLQAVVGQIHIGKSPAPGGAPGGQPSPGAPPAGGGTNLGQLQGRPPSPPTAGPGAPSSTSSTGISADDLRRVMAQQGGGGEPDLDEG